MHARVWPPSAVVSPGRCHRPTISASVPHDVDLLDLDAALGKLAAIDSRLGELVVLRFFGGMTVEEAAEGLGLSPATVKRDWSRAGHGCSASCGVVKRAQVGQIAPRLTARALNTRR
jgi:hypothetical protein